MPTPIILLVATVIAVQVATAGCAKNVSERRAASPTMTERISRDSVKGRINELGKNYVSIRNDNGESVRVRVDDHTKMDQVRVGDQVKAYVSDDGYASTIQRVTD